jgi:hypothetical protein
MTVDARDAVAALWNLPRIWPRGAITGSADLDMTPNDKSLRGSDDERLTCQMTT